MSILKLNKCHKLIFSCLIFLLYIMIMYLTREYASSRYQIRLATSFYALPYFFPFLIIPLGLANLVSNFLVGHLGIMDLIGGLCVGLLTPYSVSIISKTSINYLFSALPIILIPAFGVALWLSPLMNLPYFSLVMTIGIGQLAPATLGILLLSMIESIQECYLTSIKSYKEKIRSK